MSKLGEAKRKEGEVGTLSPAMREEEGEVGSPSPWREMKEASQTAERILKLKREMKVLRARRRSYDGCTVGKEEPQPATAREEEAQPAGAEKKRKKVVVKRRLVPQELIDYMIQNHPYDPWNGYPQEELVNRSQKFLDYYAREKTYYDKFSEYQQALINQFHDNGFAEDYIEMEASDNEDKK